ncbi:hypothetical protein EV683_10124 [Crenobacter luteus]|uniref:hypothetical protein n=1 Tax=Crenobacter luteus TaxID=1452487 RepID=UPI001044BF34|nr:hypothetical protein [Crenobacter luteus]TCP15500.1 hypothetical protein EV683_10124 [Crenobacter luteus]
MKASVWLWLGLIVTPVVTVIGTLARLARKEPPPTLPASLTRHKRFDAAARSEATRAALARQDGAGDAGDGKPAD